MNLKHISKIQKMVGIISKIIAMSSFNDSSSQNISNGTYVIFKISITKTTNLYPNKKRLSGSITGIFSRKTIKLSIRELKYVLWWILKNRFLV